MRKHLQRIIVIGTLLLSVGTVFAADKHDHKKLSTPKGGRLLEKTEPHAEFVVEKDKTVTINFYSEEMKPVSVEGQTATVIADAKGGKVTLPLQKKGETLVSSGKLPEGDGYNVVVQFKQNATAKLQNFRIKLDLHTCGECKRAEYACTCDH